MSIAGPDNQVTFKILIYLFFYIYVLISLFYVLIGPYLDDSFNEFLGFIVVNWTA